MNQIFVLTTLLSVCALTFSSLVGNNRYGAPHSGNSINYRGGANRYPAGPHSPVPPRAPAHQSYGAPAHQSYGAPKSPSYGVRQPAAPYGAGRHLSAPAAPAAPHYGSSSNYGGHGSYGPQSHASIPSHYSSPKRSVYQQPQHSAPQYSAPQYSAPQHSGPQHSASQHSAPHHSASSYSSSSRTGYGQPQTFSQSHQSSESRSQTHGREMKYTINDPKNKGTTHVTETHVVSNRQMHGAEAEAAMKKLMGSMGPGSDGGFQDLIKGMGLPFY